ncbi:MAG: SelT/SelW/SelH family protein [Haloarculaceae archaeon]
MTNVEIEYCVPCGLLDLAVETETRLLESFGRALDGIELQPGHGGVFVVRVDGETVWDKDVHGGDVDFDLLEEVVAAHVED